MSGRRLFTGTGGWLAILDFPFSILNLQLYKLFVSKCMHHIKILDHGHSSVF